MRPAAAARGEVTRPFMIVTERPPPLKPETALHQGLGKLRPRAPPQQPNAETPSKNKLRSPTVTANQRKRAERVKQVT